MSTDFSSQPPVPPPPPTNKALWMLLGGVIGSFGTCGFCIVSSLIAISFLGSVPNKTFSNVASAIQSTGS